jgi:prevent-host-death family protein
MRTVTAMDMRKRLGEILDAASAGERILIERDHKPLAYLVSVEEGRRIGSIDGERIKRRLAALDRLETFAAEMSVKYPPKPGDPDAATSVRMDRDRDDPKPGSEL